MLASAQRLTGVGDYQSTSDHANIYSSLIGKRPIQINGEDFANGLGAADHTVHFNGAHGDIAGPAITNDMDFKSSIGAGFIYYETPHVDQILPSSVRGTVSSYTSTVHVSDSGTGANQRHYGCQAAAHCKVEHDISYTPQILRIYPSTIYSGQDICFQVFTDKVTNGNRDGVTDLKIGEYNADIDTYDSDNSAAESNSNYYQQCGIAGGNKAKVSNEVHLIGDTGEYHVSEFAKSFDGTNEYVVMSAPKVTSITPQVMNPVSGTIVSIKGEGFSSVTTENVVDVQGNACQVLEASETEIKCQITVTTSDYSGTTDFVGGLGAHVVEYDGIVNSQISGTTITPVNKHFTDMISRSSTNENDNRLTRSIEAWFVPPKTGSYIFHGSCDDSCTLDLSTTPDSKSSATSILTVGRHGQFNSWSTNSTHMSAAQSLTAGQKYYMKVIFDDYGWTDYMSFGFTIDDSSTQVANSQKGWKELTINPSHVFESFELELPANPDVSYRLRFESPSYNNCTNVNDATEIFENCHANANSTCNCVSTTFTQDTSASSFRGDIDDFFNKFHTYYGTNATVVKENITDGSGATTGYKFTTTLGYALLNPSFDKINLYVKNNTDSTYKVGVNGTDYTYTFTNKDTLTHPITGSYKATINDGNGNTVDTDDIEISDAIGKILSKIYAKLPALLGKIELRDSFDTFYTYEEGRTLLYRTTGSAENFTLELANSATDPINVPNFPNQAIAFSKNDSYIPASNKPYYEVIPGKFLKTVETSPQVTVATNGIPGACPDKGTCGFTFTAQSGSISSYTFNSDYTELTIAGTSIPGDIVNYISVGSCICDLHPSYSVTATEIHCIMRDCPSGDYKGYVQTTNGALTNSGSNDLTIPIVVNSVIPTQLYKSGGQTMTFTGTNFPSSLARANAFSDFAIEFSDGKTCTATRVTPTQILCTTPVDLTVGAITVSLKFNSKTNTTSGLTVSDPAYNVESVDKPSVSAVEKQDLVITADSRPSTDLTKYHGLIVSPTTTIKMKVNSIVQDGSKYKYTVRFPGAPKGETYNLYIVYETQRFGSTTTLSTVTAVTALSVDGASNTNVNLNGGNTLILTGTAFSTDITDLVIVVGNSKGTVLSSNGTEVRALTPAGASAAEAEVTFFQKPNIESTCSVSGGCKVTYVADTQTLTSSSDLAVTDGVVTIAGTNFGANAKGYIDGVEQTTVSSTATEVQIRLTNIKDPSSVSLEVRTDSANLPSFTIATPVTQKLLSISPSTGSTGGQKVTLNVAGLGTDTTSNIAVVDSSGNALCMDGTITQVDSSKITCVTKGSHDFTSGVQFKLSLSHSNTASGVVSTESLSCSTGSDCKFTSQTSSTPSVTSATNSGNDLTVDVSGYSFDSTHTVTVYYGMASSEASSISGTTATATFANGFTPGTHPVKVKFEKDGNIVYTSSLDKTLNSASATGPSADVSCSFAGGCSIEITGAGLATGAAGGDVKVTVCNRPTTFDLAASDGTKVVALAPNYVNSHAQSSFNILETEVVRGTLISDSSTGSLAFDGITTNKVGGSGAVGVGYNFGAGNIAQLTSVRYFMGQMTDKQTNCVDKVKFQSSTDGTTWSTDVFTGDRLMRKGWNTNTFSSPVSSQYFRLHVEDIVKCPIVEVEMIGNIFVDDSATSKACDVHVTIGSGSPSLLTNKVNYQDGATTKVTSISPRYGSFKGGDTVTITGTGFSATNAQTSVLIDGIACTVSAVTSTTVTCATQARPSIVANPSTVLSFSSSSGSNGLASMQGNTFTYANDWSDPDTWGGEFEPQDGDSIVIPQGQMLIVDINESPMLNAIIVYGSLVFIPDSTSTHHRTFDANYIFIQKGGVFEAGTPDSRYTSKLTITMHGVRESTQIPTYGNKGIFVRHAQFDMHGIEKNKTWSQLDSTLAINGTQITLMDYVDWNKGDTIVVASTDFSLEHTEEFTIAEDVDNSGSTGSVISLNRKALHQHYAKSVNYTATNANGNKVKELTMRAEVGLLTRNVVFKGADDDSVENQYGAHIMLHSPGDQSLTGRISYVELTQVGQAFQLGRYPIHFHMIGTVHGSYIKGNAIHHTYNRACTIHGVHYLTLEDNFAYQTMGHTFFIEDAAETNNYLRRNLVMKSMRSWSLLNTDQTPASFWITHPTNFFIDNHAAGSEKYGFWFDLQTHATGPSFDAEICPEYEKLGEFTGNVAHSNGKYGLRIFHRYTPVENACKGLENQNGFDQPTGDGTTPVVTKFTNFVTYKNNRSGVIAEEFGALKFHNIVTADNLFAGVEFGVASVGPWLTENDEYHLQDALIVGASDNAELGLQGNVAGKLHDIGHDANEAFGGTRGLKGARSEKMRVKDILFANFDHSNSDSTPIGTCSHCEGPATDSSGRTYFMKDIYFTNETRKVTWDTPFKEIIYDEDGTLGNSTHRWLVKSFKHLEVPECGTDSKVHEGLVCDKSISIRRVLFHNGDPYNALKYRPVKVLNLQHLSASRRMLSASCGSSNKTIAAINADDAASLTLQTDLLAAYHNLQTNKTARDQEITNLENGVAGASQANIDTYNANINASQAIIDEKKPLVEPYKGKYDDLWKDDSQFCDEDLYSSIAFRFKNNPKKNWVFNAISGYEYKVHFDTGVDFLSIDTEYSDPELLQGETKGFIMHFNHTERREAMNVTYTHANGTANTVNTPSTTPLTSSSKMGDIYFNNVTRHTTVKFDGQRNDTTKFVFKGDECISWGNCNADVTEDAEIETNYRRWSNTSSWTSGALPVEGEEVLIEPTWNMLYDLEDSPVFKSIEVNGRLTIENTDKDRTLRSYSIFVRKGEMVVGTEAEPFNKTMTFELHGTRADKDVYFHTKMFEGGNKVIANTGNLTMYGKPVDVKATRLSAPAAAGAMSITVKDAPSDWKEGDKIGIAPSGRDWEQRDAVTVKNVTGNTINLNEALSFDHYGAASVDADASGSIDIRAEVVHLSRNIKIVGTNTDRWGAHIVTAHNQDSQFLNGQLTTVSRKGWAIIDHVEFFNCSQYDTDKAAVRFADISGLGSTDIKSKVTNSAIHDGLGIGIMVTGAEQVSVEGNVVWFQHIGGIWMKKSNSARFVNNVVAGMGTRWWSGDTRLDEIAAFNFCNKDQNCRDLTVTGNIAAGGQRIGFAIPTTCSAGSSEYANNTAHSVEHGSWLFKNNLCTSGTHYYGNFHAYKTVEEGIIGYQGFGNIEVSNIETLDCGIGFSPMTGVNQDNNFLTLKDSVIMGESLVLPKDPDAYCIALHGIWGS